VLLTPDADVDLPGQQEVLFHRIRLPILDQAAPPAPLPTAPNWPLRFPWPSASATLGGAAVDQRGAPALAISIPTRMILRLRDRPRGSGGGVPHRDPDRPREPARRGSLLRPPLGHRGRRAPRRHLRGHHPVRAALGELRCPSATTGTSGDTASAVPRRAEAEAVEGRDPLPLHRPLRSPLRLRRGRSPHPCPQPPRLRRGRIQAAARGARSLRLRRLR
jgi:hypothetical protein